MPLGWCIVVPGLGNIPVRRAKISRLVYAVFMTYYLSRVSEGLEYMKVKAIAILLLEE